MNESKKLMKKILEKAPDVCISQINFPTIEEGYCMKRPVQRKTKSLAQLLFLNAIFMEGNPSYLREQR